MLIFFNDLFEFKAMDPLENVVHFLYDWNQTKLIIKSIRFEMKRQCVTFLPATVQDAVSLQIQHKNESLSPKYNEWNINLMMHAGNMLWMFWWHSVTDTGPNCNISKIRNGSMMNLVSWRSYVPMQRIQLNQIWFEDFYQRNRLYELKINTNEIKGNTFTPMLIIE